MKPIKLIPNKSTYAEWVKVTHEANNKPVPPLSAVKINYSLLELVGLV